MRGAALCLVAASGVSSSQKNGGFTTEYPSTYHEYRHLGFPFSGIQLRNGRVSFVQTRKETRLQRLFRDRSSEQSKNLNFLQTGQAPLFPVEMNFDLENFPDQVSMHWESASGYFLIILKTPPKKIS